MRRRGQNIRKALLGSILPMLRVLPPEVASRVVAGIGQAEYRLRPGVRQRMDAAVARGSGYFGGHWDIQAVGRGLAGNQIRWRVRDRLLDGLTDARVAPLFEVEGRAGLDNALARGRGVVLLCTHFGAHMMPAHWLAREGYPLRLFMERPRSISRFLSRQFETDGPLGQRKLFISRRASPAESAGSILRAARILRSGSLVMIAGDVRWSGPNTALAAFLGRRYSFSTTWVTLAAVSGAPVVPVFCRMRADGTFGLEFLEPYEIPPEAQRPEAAAPWVQGALRDVEERVCRHPDNSNDYFFWPEPTDSVA